LIKITPHLSLDESELKFEFIRSPGPGGQNVNKVATAVLLRFDVKNSSLPDDVRERLLILLQSRLTLKGELLIKASSHRTQERNKQDAIER
jgi:ribosome-associated protein